MKKGRDTEAREPRVMFGVIFSINDIPIPEIKILVCGTNLDREDVIEEIEKEREKLNDRIKSSITGLSVVKDILINGEVIEPTRDGDFFVEFYKAEVKLSFLNPNFRKGDYIFDKRIN